jgi:hypothetical protein
MRTWVLPLLVAGSLLTLPSPGSAQGLTYPPDVARPGAGGAVREHVPGTRRIDGGALKRLEEKWQPMRQRVPADDRLRLLSGLVGVSVLVYEGTAGRGLPVGAVGTEALRLGLQPQLHRVRERTGFALEPSIGRRRFVLTFRRTF